MQQTVSTRFQELLAAVNNRLRHKPGRVIYVVPGSTIVWDDCCDGQLTARLASLAPVMTSGGNMVNCGVQYWRATGELTLIRCALVIYNQGVAPVPSALNKEGKEALDDSDVLLATLGDFEWVTGISSWGALGPNAGCRGITVNFTFNLDHPVYSGNPSYPSCS